MAKPPVAAPAAPMPPPEPTPSPQPPPPPASPAPVAPIASETYAHGVTVLSRSSVTVQLNRACTRYDAMVGIDDLTMGLGAARFSVYGGDGARLWQSPVLRGGAPAVPVSVGIEGQEAIRLVVEPAEKAGGVAPADWAASRISCR